MCFSRITGAVQKDRGGTWFDQGAYFDSVRHTDCMPALLNVERPGADGVDSYYRFGGGKNGSMSPSADRCGGGGGGSNSR